MTYQFYGFYIPDRMLGSLQRYIEHGVPPGDFLTAVICNDLAGAVGHGDEENQKNLPAFVGYLYNNAPAACWKSRENMDAWIALKHEF